MSGASDKARYHLEQQVPELQDLLRKNIFTKPEITSIASKRSSFEHVLAARGSIPSDYVRYAEYEMNLDALCKKRKKRLGIKTSGHSGQRKIFFILERGTRKFPGDLRLWMQFLGFARKEKARRKIKEILTSMLRLHPTKHELWLYAARWSFEEEGDMMGSRGYMQRALRFCQNERSLWVEYARLEVIYIVKIAARRRMLGLDGSAKAGGQEEELGEDTMMLPDITAEDVNPTLSRDDSVDEIALQNLGNTPALTGAIPIAIFDAAMKQFRHDEKTAERFFDVVAEFEQNSTTRRILQHMVDSMVQNKPEALQTVACQFTLPIVGVETSSAEFPTAVGESLQIVRAAMERLILKKSRIAERAISKLLPFASNKELDMDIRKVIVISLRQYTKDLGSGDIAATLVEKLLQEKRSVDARFLLDMAMKQNKSNDQLLQARASMTTVAPAASS